MPQAADDTDPAVHNVPARLRMLEANGGELLARVRRLEADFAGAIANVVSAAERQLFSISELVADIAPDVADAAPNGNGHDDVPTSEERGRG